MALILRAVLASTLFTALAAGPVYAQLDRGQIAGFVKDQTGGVIPGATVTATQTSDRTDVHRRSPMRTGYYVFPRCRPACTTSRSSCRASRSGSRPA